MHSPGSAETPAASTVRSGPPFQPRSARAASRSSFPAWRARSAPRRRARSNRGPDEAEAKRHGARAVYQDAIARFDAAAFEADDGRARRRHQGSRGVGHIAGKAVQELDGDDAVLGEAPVRRHADLAVEGTPAVVLADGIKTADTVSAASAPRVAFGGNAVARCEFIDPFARRHDIARPFVAGDERIDHAGHLSLDQMNIRPAETARLHPHQHLARTRLGLRHIDQFVGMWLFDEYSAHRKYPP